MSGQDQNHDTQNRKHFVHTCKDIKTTNSRLPYKTRCRRITKYITYLLNWLRAGYNGELY